MKTEVSFQNNRQEVHADRINWFHNMNTATWVPNLSKFFPLLFYLNMNRGTKWLADYHLNNFYFHFASYLYSLLNSYNITKKFSYKEWMKNGKTENTVKTRKMLLFQFHRILVSTTTSFAVKEKLCAKSGSIRYFLQRVFFYQHCFHTMIFERMPSAL